MGLIDQWRAGVAQGKRQEEERRIVERHMKEREKRQDAKNPPPLAQAFGRAAGRVQPATDKVKPIAQAVKNWVFTGSTDGVRRGQWARDNRPASGSRQASPRPPRQPQVVYVRERPPRKSSRKRTASEPEYSGWGAGWGKL